MQRTYLMIILFSIGILMISCTKEKETITPNTASYKLKYEVDFLNGNFSDKSISYTNEFNENIEIDSKENSWTMEISDIDISKNYALKVSVDAKPSEEIHFVAKLLIVKQDEVHISKSEEKQLTGLTVPQHIQIKLNSE